MNSENALAAKSAKCLKKRLSFFHCFLIVATAFLSHYKALTCFFLSDDLLCLDYLYKAFHGQAGIFLERLLSPWQDPSISLLYRPLCDLYFFLDYALYGSKPSGYHLTNILLHVGCSLLVYYNIQILNEAVFAKRNLLIALVSAILFASSPLHVEPVVWLVGRADLSAALFLLLSLALTIEAFVRGKKLAVLPLCFYFLALLSKESAACEPAIIFTLSVFLPAEKQVRKFKLTVLRTLPFVLITFAYLALRFVVLGTFLGGYTGSLGAALGEFCWKHLLDLNRLALLFFGTNISLFEPASIEVNSLHGLFLLAALLLLLRIPINPWDSATLRTMAFLLLSGVISLLPALQVSSISGSLSNERVYYLASAFFIPLFVFALIPCGDFVEKAQSRWLPSIYGLAVVTLLALSAVYACVSCKSYAAWQEASNILRKLQCSGINALNSVSGKKKLVILFQLANWKGAHLAYEFKELKTLLGPNFTKPDHTEKLLALDEYPDFYATSMQRLRRLLSDPAKYELLCFEPKAERLIPVLPATRETDTASPAELSPAKSKNCLDKAYWVNFERPVRLGDESMFEVNIEEQGQSARFATFCLTDKQEIPEQAFLTVGSSSQKKLSRAYHIPTDELRRLVGAEPACHVYCTVALADSVAQCSLLPGKYLAQLEPDLSSCDELNNGNYFAKDDKFVLNLDVSKVPGSAGMQLELAEPNYLFGFGKVCTRDPQTYSHIQRNWQFAEIKKTLALPLADFKPGYRYAFRLIALDRSGAGTGFYSDSVCLDLRKPFF